MKKLLLMVALATGFCVNAQKLEVKNVPLTALDKEHISLISPRHFSVVWPSAVDAYYIDDKLLISKFKGNDYELSILPNGDLSVIFDSGKSAYFSFPNGTLFGYTFSERLNGDVKYHVYKNKIFIKQGFINNND